MSVLSKDAIAVGRIPPGLVVEACAAAFASVLARMFPLGDLQTQPGHGPAPAVPPGWEDLPPRAIPPSSEEHPQALPEVEGSGGVGRMPPRPPRELPTAGPPDMQVPDGPATRGPQTEGTPTSEGVPPGRESPAQTSQLPPEACKDLRTPMEIPRLPDAEAAVLVEIHWEIQPPSKAQEAEGLERHSGRPVEEEPDGTIGRPSVRSPVPVMASPPQSPGGPEAGASRTPRPDQMPARGHPAGISEQPGSPTFPAGESPRVREGGAAGKREAPLPLSPLRGESESGEAVPQDVSTASKVEEAEGSGSRPPQPSWDVPAVPERESQSERGFPRSGGGREASRSEPPPDGTRPREGVRANLHEVPPADSLSGQVRGGDRVEAWDRTEGVRFPGERPEYGPLPNRLRLELPDPWGEPVRVEVRGRSDAVWARVEGGPEVARVVRAHESALHQALSERGVALVGLEVSVLAQGDGRAPGAPESLEGVRFRPARARSPGGLSRGRAGAVDYVV